MKQWMTTEELLKMAQKSSSLAEFRKTARLPEASTEAALLITMHKLAKSASGSKPIAYKAMIIKNLLSMYLSENPYNLKLLSY